MKECSKSIIRRLGDTRFVRRFFVGNGIDIGGLPDPLILYREFFPLMNSVKTWDKEDGDANHMAEVGDDSFDFVHSSHCLEHMHDPVHALKNWIRILKEGGHCVLALPDEDLYEQGIFPSRYNSDHKNTFSLNKTESWSAKHINVLSVIQALGSAVELIKLEKIDEFYRYELPDYDQTITPVCESAIEIVLRKRSAEEMKLRTNRIPSTATLSQEVLLHLNQYKDDIKTLKKGNAERAPFTNNTPLK